MKNETAGIQTGKIALLIDVENLVGGASSSGLPIEVAPIIDRLKEYGRVLIRRSFGDLDKCMSSIGRGRETQSIRRMLHQNLFQIEEIPYITANKNTSDIRLVVESLALAFQMPEISHFAVVASDRDYVPLFNKLHELGKMVVSVSIDPATTNAMMREASDILIYYNSLFEKPTFPDTQASDQDTEKKQIFDSYLQALSQAVRSMENQSVKPLGTSLSQAIRQLRSDFDPELAGCSSFKGFIEKAVQMGIVLVDWGNGFGDFVVTSNPEARLLQKTFTLPQPSFLIEPTRLADEYKRIVEEKLRIPLPNTKTRTLILKSLRETYDVLLQDGPIALADWNAKTVESLRDKNVDSKVRDSVYKMLLSLFFAKCFYWEPGVNELNPRVVGLAHPPEEWKDQLDRHFTRTICMEVRGQSPSPKGLALTLWGDIAQQYTERAAKLIEEAKGA